LCDGMGKGPVAVVSAATARLTVLAVVPQSCAAAR